MNAPTLIAKFHRIVDEQAARMEWLAHGGRARVVKLKCRDCRRWVSPHDWNPGTAVCEVCARYVVAAVGFFAV